MRAVRAGIAALAVLGAAVSASAGDPMRPDSLRSNDSRNSARAPIYTVSAIFSASGDRIAVLNGKTVREGDDAGAVTVSTIGNDHVVLETPHGPLVVRLNGKKTQ